MVRRCTPMNADDCNFNCNYNFNFNYKRNYNYIVWCYCNCGFEPGTSAILK